MRSSRTPLRTEDQGRGAAGHDINRFDIMLARMFGTTGDGLSDRLMAFTKPVSGSFYFVPAIGILASIC